MILSRKTGFSSLKKFFRKNGNKEVFSSSSQAAEMRNTGSAHSALKPTAWMLPM